MTHILTEPKPESQEESDWQNSDISDPLWKVVSNAFKTHTPEAAVKWLKYQGYRLTRKNMTLDEAKDQVAKNNGWDNFTDYYYSISANKWTLLRFMEEVFELLTKSETVSEEDLKSALIEVNQKNKKHRESLNLGLNEAFRGAPDPLIAYLRRASRGHTEFRLVVKPDGSAYIHAIGQDSETFDFTT